MKTLIINGSPKSSRSNSIKLAEAFVKGMNCGDAEIIDLSKQDIKPCKGCFGCWKATPGQCVIRDDMTANLEKLIAADVVIFSFPLYYFSVPGILKNFIDRQLPMVLPFMEDRTDGVGSGSHPGRYDMSGKRYVLVSTCGFYSAEGNYDAVCGMFDHICGKNNYEKIFCGQGELFAIDALRDRTGEYLKIVEKAGKEFAGGRIGEQTRKELSCLIFPKEQFEAMADASWGVSRDGSGEKEHESLTFTRQMAGLYNKNAYDGKVRVLEMHYTDIDKTYQIRLAEKSEVFTDGSQTATTTIHTPYTVWKDIAEGKENGTNALAKHLYRVEGDFDLMINWGKFFGAETSSEPAPDNLKAPHMSAMLIPWCVFWTAIQAAGTAVGGPISMAAAVITPLIFMKHKQTIYDKISPAAVALLSLWAMLAGSVFPVIPVSYGIFGLMWCISCFTKEPMCAAYVKYNYGGESALNNVIFMKTNYILAWGWGILYLIMTAVWTIFCRSGVSPIATVIGSVLPAAMGVFTVFFQNWYPKHTASI